MISKVNDASAQMIQQYQKIDSIKSNGEKPVSAGTTVATERVDLSNKARDIQKIKQDLEQIPEIREEKVNELKRQIENGSYAINPARIVDKMLEESLIDIIA
jgi:negative regulator of flagellin synthesis FlgM